MIVGVVIIGWRREALYRLIGSAAGVGGRVLLVKLAQEFLLCSIRPGIDVVIGNRLARRMGDGDRPTTDLQRAFRTVENEPFVFRSAINKKGSFFASFVLAPRLKCFALNKI